MVFKQTPKYKYDAPYYGRHFDQWRFTCPTEWQELTRHKFILSLADGSLPDESFIRYLRQNYIFLIHFARAWGQAASMGSDIAEIRMATSITHQVINSKMQMYIDLCNDYGISERELFQTEEDSATTAYVIHFENVGASGDFIDMMAVLSPSVLGYAEIGSFLASLKTAPKYQRWITTYTDKNHQVSCHHIGRVIDDAIVHRLGADAMTTARWQTLCDRFRITTKLEANYLHMSLAG